MQFKRVHHYNSGVARVWQSMALTTPTFTQLLDSFLSSLCEHYSEYKILSIFSVLPPFANDNIIL
jgi:hypothetical protein